MIEVAALNVVASPHPSGIYSQILFDVAGNEIPLWGSDWGKITAPEEIEATRDGVQHRDLFHGQILVWAKIDTEGKWLNTETDKEATTEEKQAVEEALPDNLEPNFRPFTYVLDQKRHLVFIESKNELGQRFSPRRAERFFSRLFETLSGEMPSVDVTVVPEEETLDKIFAIKKLRKLEIFIKRPNPDDLGDEYARIMQELESEGAQSQKIEKVKAPKMPSLTPSEETKTLAKIASTNGYAAGEGKDESGTPIFVSTEEHPKIRKLEVRTSAFSTILSALRLW